MPRLISVVCLAVLGIFEAQASILNLDLLVVRQPSWVRDRDNTHWPYATLPPQQAIAPSLAVRDGNLGWFTGPSSGFADATKRLQSNGYETLYLASFRFEQTRLRGAQVWSIEQGTPLSISAEDPYADTTDVGQTWFEQSQPAVPESVTPLSGWLRSWVDTYLFVEFDLAWIEADPYAQPAADRFEPNPASTDWPLQEAEPGFSPAQIWPREAIRQHRIAERKRVRLNEIHYFDHPMIGILVRVTEPEIDTVTAPQIDAPEGSNE